MQLFDDVERVKAVLVATDILDENLAKLLNLGGVVVICGGDYEGTDIASKAEELIVLTRNVRDNYPDVPLVLLGSDAGSYLAQLVVQKAAIEYRAAVYLNPLYIKGFRLRRLKFINKASGIASIPKKLPILMIAKDCYAKKVDRLYNKYLEHALKKVVVKMHHGEMQIETVAEEISEFINEQI
jgi:hypothetical protein